jgi:aminomethyltransferase
VTSHPRKTPLNGRHKALGATLVDFAGWQMPVRYKGGIIAEHLATRTRAGLFDVSHMGRVAFRGAGALPFLMKALTNDASTLEVGRAQYTLIPTETGGAIDDAYLYRFLADEYLLVVNAANRERDLGHFRSLAGKFPNLEIIDRTDELAMLSLQGPLSQELLGALLEDGRLPCARRNRCSTVNVAGVLTLASRTGYTGEPLCFELIVDGGDAPRLWDALVEHGAEPAGLGARDTLRLEAGLPLFGHELGEDPDGNEIPLIACPAARGAVSFAPGRGEFTGRSALKTQFDALRAFRSGGIANADVLKRTIVPLAVIGRSAARAGDRVLDRSSGARVGWVTSGTSVPYTPAGASTEGAKAPAKPLTRPIALALIDAGIDQGTRVIIEAGKRRRTAFVVPFHLRVEGERTVPVIYDVEDREGDSDALYCKY